MVGDTKPQFSLIGDTVNKTSRVCSLTQALACTVSKETRHFLELYTNNLRFDPSSVEMKGIGKEPIYVATVIKGNRFSVQNTLKSKSNEALSFVKNQKDKETNQTS